MEDMEIQAELDKCHEAAEQLSDCASAEEQIKTAVSEQHDDQEKNKSDGSFESLLNAYKAATLEAQNANAQIEKIKREYSPDSMLSKPEFMEKVLSDPTVQARVIEKYLKGINSSGAVQLMSGGQTACSPALKPTTLKEAKVLADMLLGQ